MSTASLETYVDLGRNRLETMLKVLDVDGAVRRVRGGWESTGREWAYDADRYARVTQTREREQQAMLDYLTTTECRMRYLREQLDDDGAVDCGRCDNCGGFDPATGVSDGALEEAGARLARPGVVVEPRKMWPTALANLGIDLKGKIVDGAAEGRAVARLTDLGHGRSLRELFREGVPDGPVPDALARAVVEVLLDWRPRVEGLVVVESATRPELTRSLGEGLSRFLKKPVVGRWAITDPGVDPGRGASNSAQRVAAVTRRFTLEADVPTGPVLLVDDRVVTGWTLTLAARALRQAGATEVLPLLLASGG